MAVMVAVTAWPFSMALRSRAGGLRMIVLLGVGQAAMHTALVVASWSIGPASAPVPHGAMGAMGGAAEISFSAPEMGHPMSVRPGPAMILAHLLAAVVLGLILADADRALFAFLGLLAAPVRVFGRRLVQCVLALLGFGAHPKTVRESDDRGGAGLAVQRLRQRLFSAAIGRRGPPTVLV
jgi:hypothetical protein